jgi:ATP-dependent DNA helicase DinG
LSLHFTPFEIADRLRGYVEARPCAWVFTSATLAIGDDFSHFANRIGLPDARTLYIESPFDYRDQARIYLPRGMPEPQHPQFAAKFIDAVAPLLEATGGRAFLLYTSYRGLAEGVAALKARFPAAISRAGARSGAARSAAQSISRAGQCRALGHGQLLGGRGREGRRAVHRGHRQVALRRSRRSFAQRRASREFGGAAAIRFSEYQLPQAVLA